MKRQIKFKAIRVDNGEWVEGYYVFRPYGKHLIYWKPFDGATQNTYHEVIPDTVCQFTGLQDKNGKDIYEGDILTGDDYPFKDEGVRNYDAVVEFIFGCWQGVYVCVNPLKRGISDGVNNVLNYDGDPKLKLELTGKNIHDKNRQMKEQDLRIGNFIEYHSFEGDGGFYEIEQICKDSEGFKGYYIVFRNGSFKVSIEENELIQDRMIQPIPLTEEWLLKFGFEKDGTMSGCYNYEFENIRILKSFINKDSDYSVCPIGVSPSTLSIAKLKHVHQLQNLYHALTGEELTIQK